MDPLATALPEVHILRRLPLTRDQAMLLMAAVNEAFLGLDTYLAHATSGTVRPNEWIPVLFGPAAGALLIFAGALAPKMRQTASVIATLTFIASIAVGFLGAYFHLMRAALPTGPEGEVMSLSLLVWAPPIMGPLTFSLVGILGISAAWIERPTGSGRLILPAAMELALPYSKTQAYLLMVSMGALAALLSAALDHARAGYDNPWLWVPIAAGVFGGVYQFYFKEKLAKYNQDERFLGLLVKTFKDLGVGIVSLAEARPADGYLLIDVDECITCAGTEPIGKNSRIRGWVRAPNVTKR